MANDKLVPVADAVPDVVDGGIFDQGYVLQSRQIKVRSIHSAIVIQASPPLN
jgi:hypothetical protein